MKVCCSCHQLKPLDAYNVRRTARDGRQSRCRECCKAWYSANAARHKANVSRRNARAREDAQRRLAVYFREHPCVDCGEADVRCLDFDHEPGRGKSANIGDLLRSPAPWRLIEAEIAKCEVRCANCHRRRTAERGRFWRQTVHEQDQFTWRTAAATRLAALTSS